MAEQLNDVMDASVSALNKTTEESRLALENWLRLLEILTGWINRTKRCWRKNRRTAGSAAAVGGQDDCRGRERKRRI